jgi:hypothetical protein
VDVPKHEHLLAEVFRQQLGSVWQLVGGRPSQHHDATPEGAVGIFATNGTWNDHCWLGEMAWSLTLPPISSAIRL